MNRKWKQLLFLMIVLMLALSSCFPMLPGGPPVPGGPGHGGGPRHMPHP